MESSGFPIYDIMLSANIDSIYFFPSYLDAF